MTSSAERRILLVGRTKAFHERFALLFPQVDASAHEGASEVSPLVWPHPDAILVNAAFESIYDSADAADCIRKAIQEHRPFLLAVADLTTDAENGVAVVRSLLETDHAILVLGNVGGDAATWERLAAIPAAAHRFTFLRDSLSAIEVRQSVTAQLHRRLLRDEMRRTLRELDAGRRSLEHAREEVEEARKAKTEFLANISHELRTPMSAILGFSSLLLKEPLTPGQNEKARAVREAGESLLQLIENILDLAKCSTGSLELSVAAFELDKVIGDASTPASAAAKRKGIAMECVTEPAVPRWLRGDAARLCRVLATLLDNAVKFTHRGEVRLQVVLEEETDVAVLLRIIVSDTGEGIPVDRQSMIFESFTQADGSATREFGGLGVGLPLSKQLVELMGGQIGFRSIVGEGTSFWVSVPFEKATPLEQHGRVETKRSGVDQAAVGAFVDAAKARGAGSAKHRILVAEGDRMNRTLLELFLSRAGGFVDLVSNMREAAAAMTAHPYDLLFLDTDASTAEVLEAVREIRREELGSGRRLRVVALTSWTQPTRQRELIDAGADDFVTKPFSPDTLTAVIQRQMPGLFEPPSTGALADRLGTAVDVGGWSERLETKLQLLWNALEGTDYRTVEACAQAVKELANEIGSPAIADQALRVQLAARRRDRVRTTNAAERLRESARESSAAASTTAG